MESKTIVQNRYRLEKRLGHEAGGATGTVYLATDLQLEEKVAVKLLRPVFASDRDLIRELRNSFEGIAAIKHPSIARYRDFIVSGDHLAIVSDYFDGLTLEDVLTKRGPLPFELAKDYMLQLCTAMQLAHSHGVGHYDLTRRNVMIGKSGDLVLCDMGISRRLKDSLLHSPGGKKVTGLDRASLVEYLPAEQRVGKPAYQITCDIYAAGILLHEMRTGKFPDLSAYARKVAKTPEKQTLAERELVQTGESAPGIGNYIVRKALSFKPWQRWENFIIMSYALEGKIQTRSAPLEARGSFAAPLTNRLLKRRIVGFLLVGLLLLGAIWGIAKLIGLIPTDITRPREALTEYLSENVEQGKKVETVPKKPEPPKPNPGLHFANARKLIAERKLDAAEKEILTGLDQKGDAAVGGELLRLVQKHRTITSFLEQAKLRIKNGQFVEAGVFLDQVLQMAPENLEAPGLKSEVDKRQSIIALLKRAREAFDKKAFTTPEAESAYHFVQDVLEKDPGNKDALAIVTDLVKTYTSPADRFFDSGDFGKALFYYRKVLSIDKDNPHAIKRANLSRERYSAERARPKPTPEDEPVSASGSVATVETMRKP
ncbi:MAG TPA: serine/threonine-protein kinase [bacterium]|nr:serine/threonine-protein kinase [bacterium]